MPIVKQLEMVLKIATKWEQTTAKLSQNGRKCTKCGKMSKIGGQMGTKYHKMWDEML